MEGYRRSRVPLIGSTRVDCRLVTACNTREKMKIVTWNVRTMYQSGKLENIVLETKRMGIDIMGLADVRWLQSGKIVWHDHTLNY